MSVNNPPRFVPTLTETVPNSMPDTSVEDSSYVGRRDAPDSMLDLDLTELDGPVHRIDVVSPLGAYQGIKPPVNPLAVSQFPVGMQPAVARPVAAPPSVPVQPAVPTPAPAAAKPPPTLQSLLPRDWQAQLQQSVQQAVRQELQQQMPFLLLQWSKQIEEKVTPHIQQQLVKIVQGWQTPSA